MSRFFCFYLLLLIGCSPGSSREELANDQSVADSTALEEVVDSVSNTRIDGTATTTLPVEVKQQIPVELDEHLDRTHGLWQLPTLTAYDVQRVPQGEQGPYFVQADFNGDQQQDYAIQIVERDSTFVYVFLKKAKGFQEHLLERNRLYDMDGSKRKIHYLTLAKKTNRYYNYATKKAITIPHDGVSVGSENSIASYVWEDDKFRKYEKRD